MTLARLLVALSCMLAAFVAVAEIRVKDDLGREVVLDGPAGRVVSLAPHITEVIFAAGAGEQLVGAVSYSNYPEAAKHVRRVGTYNSVSLETMVALKPDLVFAWHSGNGEEIVSRLEGLGIRVYVERPRNLEAVAHSLRMVGRLTGNELQGNAAAADYLATLDSLRETYGTSAPVSVYYQIWDEPLLTLNDDHIISDVIRLCGGRNVFADAIPLVSRISVESVIRVDPQVIVASGMDEARPEWLDAWRRWTGMQAVRENQLYFVPPDILQRHTPRIMQGAAMLCSHLQSAREHYFGAASAPDQ